MPARLFAVTGTMPPSTGSNRYPNGAFYPGRVARVVVGEGPLPKLDRYFSGFAGFEVDFDKTLKFLRGAG